MLPNAGTSMTVDDEAKHESLMGDITMPIDYERMKRVYPKQKAALTRAIKKGYPAVLATCKAAVEEWNQIGAWPDAWSMWNRALSDAAFNETMRTGKVTTIAHLDQI